MPYDARLVSEGGNRGAGELFKLRAPAGKFRVVCVDTFDGGDWVDGDYDTREAALKRAQEKGAPMLCAHVYDDQGKHIGNVGTF